MPACGTEIFPVLTVPPFSGIRAYSLAADSHAFIGVDTAGILLAKDFAKMCLLTNFM